MKKRSVTSSIASWSFSAAASFLRAIIEAFEIREIKRQCDENRNTTAQKMEGPSL